MAAAAAPSGSPKLRSYRAKRDFAKTPEPSGSSAPTPDGHRFVVQRHRARRLHYDLRLELDGVLVSWAVPKGPTLDADVKRLAAHVEDHPLDYFDFEGTIPAGEYGGGDVIVWDWGTWTPAPGTDPQRALRRGDLHFDVAGIKLAGRFALVRRGQDDRSWMLFKKHDDHAVAGWDPEQHPHSVKSGRTNDQVRDAPAATWSSHDVWSAPSADELDALDDLPTSGTWAFAGHELRLTNLDKVMFPGRGPYRSLTKRDLIRHYARMAPVMLPYLAGRPVNPHRYPDGVSKPGFWHKAAPDHAPDWITRWRNRDADAGETEVYLVLDTPAALPWVANFGAIELHPWTSTADHPHRPTWALFDIDPGERTRWADVLAAARLHRTALEHLGVQAMPKVTGRRGIQIWVPVADRYTFEETRTWVERVSRTIGAMIPELVSWRWHVSERAGKMRLDYTQNAINKTLVAPWSARPGLGGPVSVPIRWGELDDPELRPNRWRLHNVAERIEEAGDPLAPLVGRRQTLPRL
ncbi:non-homologous end-joining DNA ligase [Desertimonas flava]|uniref:non-homologous end-joining DNA ligase n=1 Tax=Desertimonas flava TaxID=2064846 RepID=UPI000E347A27|nr:non-homologous end-joining DNA ligase [Desertimonas flava]